LFETEAFGILLPDLISIVLSHTCRIYPNSKYNHDEGDEPIIGFNHLLNGQVDKNKMERKALFSLRSHDFIELFFGVGGIIAF
jgi:hypothetical protein